MSCCLHLPARVARTPVRGTCDTWNSNLRQPGEATIPWWAQSRQQPFLQPSSAAEGHERCSPPGKEVDGDGERLPAPLAFGALQPQCAESFAPCVSHPTLELRSYEEIINDMISLGQSPPSLRDLAKRTSTPVAAAHANPCSASCWIPRANADLHTFAKRARKPIETVLDAICCSIPQTSYPDGWIDRVKANRFFARCPCQPCTANCALWALLLSLHHHRFLAFFRAFSRSFFSPHHSARH